MPSSDFLLLQVERLQGTITKLKAENVEYRSNNKTQQFEASIQELQQKLQQTGTCQCLTCPIAWKQRRCSLSSCFDCASVDNMVCFCSLLLAGARRTRSKVLIEQEIEQAIHCQACLCAAEGAKVTAERALHELQLDMRSQVEKYNQLHEARRYICAPCEFSCQQWCRLAVLLWEWLF